MRVLVLLVVIAVLIGCSENPNQKDDSEYYGKLGDKLFRKSDYDGSAKMYSKAIKLAQEIDDSKRSIEIKNKYLYKRSEVYYLMKKYDFSIQDLKSIVSTEEKIEVYKLLGKVYLIVGKLYKGEEATKHAIELLREISDKKVGKKIKRVEKQMKKIKEAQVILANVTNENCVHSLGVLLKKYSQGSETFRIDRIKCAIKTKDFLHAKTEIQHILKADPNSGVGLYMYSFFLYSKGLYVEAKKSLANCLSLDPDHHECRALFKRSKSIIKGLSAAEENFERGKFQKAAREYEKLLVESEGNLYDIVKVEEKICTCYMKLSLVKKGKEKCEKCAKELNAECMFNMLDLMLADTETEEDVNNAEEYFRKIKELHAESFQNRVMEFQRRIEVEKKKLTRKDFYKIMGVTKRATSHEIRKKFRKLSMQWHPDRCEEERKDECSKMYMDLNEGYEILMDDEKRRRYDAGEDVMDIQSGRKNNPGGNFGSFFNFGGPENFFFHQQGGGGGGRQQQQGGGRGGGGGFRFNFG